MSHLGSDFVEDNFPGMVKRCEDMGFDLANEPVEVSPTSHFIMGGVRIDSRTRSQLEGLFVAGEDAGGVHGANRIGGNGVAESTVFGCIAGEVIPQVLPERRRIRPAQCDTIIDKATAAMSRPKGESLVTIKSEMLTMMWDKVGLVRNRRDLDAASAELQSLVERLNRVSIGASRNYNLEWTEFLNMQNFLLVSRLIAISALAREDSRGSHYRSDFPKPDNEKFLKNVYVGADFKVSLRPVRLDRIKPS